MSNTDNSKIKDVQKQVDETTHIMKDNIESIIERGEKIENLEMKTIQLEKDAKDFRGKARDLKRHFCIQNAKMIGIISCIVIVIILIIIAAIYGSANTSNNVKH